MILVVGAGFLTTTNGIHSGLLYRKCHTAVENLFIVPVKLAVLVDANALRQIFYAQHYAVVMENAQDRD